MKYIATFYSHFGAIKFKKECSKINIFAKLMPVPRDLSSSCGTCVLYEADDFCPVSEIFEEIEQIVEITGTGYTQHFKAKDS